jgi:hypothetical protein
MNTNCASARAPPRPQQVHALVGLEVAGVEDDRARVEAQRARSAATLRRGRRRIDEGRVLDLEDARAGRARATPSVRLVHTVITAAAWRRACRSRRGRRPCSGPRRANPDSRSWSGIDESTSTTSGSRGAGQRRGQMGGLFDRVHDVEAAASMRHAAWP